jgi:PAS domain S-box-containing protein
VNLNKLFPRLAIRWKLAIAFVAMAGIPLLIVGAVGTSSALSELRRAARADLRHDLDLAAARTSRSLAEVGAHVSFLEAAGLGGVATGVEARERERLLGLARTYLDSDSSALLRIKVLDADGFVTGVAERGGGGVLRGEQGAGPLLLYRWAAERLEPNGTAFLPVDLAGASESEGALNVVPAVAVVRPLFGPAGMDGVLVGEADAAELFRGLDEWRPELQGVTGLVNGSGFYLYHSRLKSDWGSLLNTDAVNLEREFPIDIARRILAGEASLEAPGGVEVATRSLSVVGQAPTGLVLYRTVPLGVLYARVAGFLGVLSLIGILLVVTVAALSLIAAAQITHPVLRIQEAAHRIAEGGTPEPVLVETNDELEDLAGDFNRMAVALQRHRTDLESLVEERTRALKRAQQELAQFVSSSADAIVGLDADRRILLWNRGAESLFGYPEAEVQGQRLDDVIGGQEGRNQAEEAFFSQGIESSGSVVNYRTRRRAKDGATIPVTLTLTALRDAEGEVYGYSVILRDDRTRDLAEDQMRRSERLSAISVMAAGLAHELNNPLSVVGNRLELMQREAMARDGDRRLLKDLDVVRKHVDRIGAITGDLLRFARNDSEALGDVDVHAVVDRTVRLLQRVFVASDIELEVDEEVSLPTAFANENIVETILVNLLLNARQATPAGGKVEIRTRSVHGMLVEIEVRDTGPGVPLDMRRRIFEPFFTTKSDQGGTGLGLAVCRALADRLGGTLEVSDWEGGGASFVLSLAQDAHARITA